MVKLLRKSWARFPKFSVFISQKSIFRRYCIQNVKDRIQIQVYNINNDTANHFSQFILVKVKKNLRNSQAQFWTKLRKLRLRQNEGFLIQRNLCLSNTNNTNGAMEEGFCKRGLKCNNTSYFNALIYSLFNLFI